MSGRSWRVFKLSIFPRSIRWAITNNNNDNNNINNKMAEMECNCVRYNGSVSVSHGHDVDSAVDGSSSWQSASQQENKTCSSRTNNYFTVFIFNIYSFLILVPILKVSTALALNKTWFVNENCNKNKNDSDSATGKWTEH